MSNHQHSSFAVRKSTALYVGIVRKPPTTMTDLEMAAVPSKFVDIAIKHPTVTLSVRQSQRAKIAHETSWNLSNRSHGNYGTQFYTMIDDDPRPAPTTCHHEISDAITFRKPQCTTTAQPNIRNAQSQTLCHQDTLTPVPLHNDPSSMAHMLHAITTSTTSAQHSKQRTPRKMIYKSNTYLALLRIPQLLPNQTPTPLPQSSTPRPNMAMQAHYPMLSGTLHQPRLSYPNKP